MRHEKVWYLEPEDRKEMLNALEGNITGFVEASEMNVGALREYLQKTFALLLDMYMTTPEEKEAAGGN